MIKTLIADDEELARERLKKILNEHEQFYPVWEAENGAEAINIIEVNAPEVVFLDIQMPIYNGFEVIRNIKKIPIIIFVTAYDAWAIKAFEVNAVDYLLKPYTKNRLLEAIEKIRNRDYLENEVNRINKLIETYTKERQGSKYLSNITVKNEHIYKTIEINKIDFFKIIDGLVFLFSGDEKYLIDCHLNKLQERLDPTIFFRVHRNAIINMTHIKRIIPWGQGKLVIELLNDKRVQVSRYKIKEFKYAIGIEI